MTIFLKMSTSSCIHLLKNHFKNFRAECHNLMELLASTILWDSDMKPIPFETVIKRKTVLLLYFTAEFCSDADEEFLPTLKKIYQESKTRNIAIEIIFVSLDNDEQKMMTLFRKKHGAWFAIPFGSPLINELQAQFNCTSMPQVYVIKVATGELISNNGKHEIEKIGLNVLVTWVE